MGKFIFLMICIHCFLGSMGLPAAATADKGIIYIQEDRTSMLISLLSQVFENDYKGIISVCAAFFCASAMIILAITHKKQRK